MGQYYTPVLVYPNTGNPVKVETFYSHDYDNGMKLTEHSWIGNNFVAAVMARIRRNPACLVWLGDYANQLKSYEIPNGVAYQNVIALKAVVDSDKHNVTPLKLGGYPSPKNPGGYLVNHNQQTFLSLKNYSRQNKPDENGWWLHPLPLLTAVGNGQGGGDYDPELGQADIGAWANDLIEFFPSKKDIPKGYEETMVWFDSTKA